MNYPNLEINREIIQKNLDDLLEKCPQNVRKIEISCGRCGKAFFLRRVGERFCSEKCENEFEETE